MEAGDQSFPAREGNQSAADWLAPGLAWSLARPRGTLKLSRPKGAGIASCDLDEVLRDGVVARRFLGLQGEFLREFWKLISGGYEDLRRQQIRPGE